MSVEKHSAVIHLHAVLLLRRKIAAALRRDQLSVYAAQASFFLLLSTIPLLVLMLNVSRLLSQETVAFLLSLLRSGVPEEFHGLLSVLLDEIEETGGIPLLSITAVTALWSASRGMAALERGLGGVYGLDISRGLVRDSIRSLLYTAVFILLIPASLLLLVFGAQIADIIMSALPALEAPITRLMEARGLLMFAFLTLFFALEHRLILRHSHTGDRMPMYLPGAMLSAAGWMLFSYLYSLYIRYFPRSAQVYGSLALLVILMLWLYFCMIIFLLGAEINKALNRWTEAKK